MIYPILGCINIIKLKFFVNLIINYYIFKNQFGLTRFNYSLSLYVLNFKLSTLISVFFYKKSNLI
jgi:hypothetical protein